MTDPIYGASDPADLAAAIVAVRRVEQLQARVAEVRARFDRARAARDAGERYEAEIGGVL